MSAGEPACGTGEGPPNPGVRTPAIRPVPPKPEAPPHPFGESRQKHTRRADPSRFIPPGEVEAPIPEGFFDPRENEPWFQKLTPREQDHFRRVWMKEQFALTCRAKWDRERLLHSVVECVLLFAIGQFFLVDTTILSIVLGCLVGVGAGVSAHLIQAGRGQGMLLGFAAMVVLQTLSALLTGRGVDVFSLLLFWMLTIATFMSGGMRREAERFGA